jgi:uncharacterized pyridoxal phosphate-containing UPF0001 family protein
MSERYETVNQWLQSVHGSVELVAVSKQQPPEAIRWLYSRHQHRVFGENYVQELEGKIAALSDLAEAIEWHFVGRMQRTHVNRLARLISAGQVQCLHSLDDVRIAAALQQRIDGTGMHKWKLNK